MTTDSQPTPEQIAHNVMRTIDGAKYHDIDIPDVIAILASARPAVTNAACSLVIPTVTGARRTTRGFACDSDSVRRSDAPQPPPPLHPLRHPTRLLRLAGTGVRGVFVGGEEEGGGR